MSKSHVPSSALALAVGITLSANASAQESPEVVVVTGSYIRGVQQTALPITVLSSDDLEKRGSPSMVELVKSVPAIQGVMGDANQFGAGYSLGSATINLRGLGPLRALVLLNGRRVAPNPAINVGVDANLLPAAAIGRIELLKDGAAATYGSDDSRASSTSSPARTSKALPSTARTTTSKTRTASTPRTSRTAGGTMRPMCCSPRVIAIARSCPQRIANSRSARTR
jgi:outer membrane receptor protein involved in Fe transport